MQETTKSKKRHQRDFKLGAASLVVDGGRKPSEVAKEVGVSPQTIASWVRSYKEHKGESFPGSGKLPASEQALREVQEENRKLKMQVEFLKKTMFYFVEAPK